MAVIENDKGRKVSVNVSLCLSSHSARNDSVEGVCTGLRRANFSMREAILPSAAWEGARLGELCEGPGEGVDGVWETQGGSSAGQLRVGLCQEK
mmetsp:Transcript_8366/g.20444  ORF Transcript_8366/g.20444 Transcript_8366/m.20444 type:complete len:94 (-) Transcript_8366:366-647(-)